MDSQMKKTMVYSILDFLENENDNNLQVASQIISEKYGVYLNQTNLRLPLNLEQVFQEGVKSSGITIQNQTDLENDEEYKLFLKKLIESNYFENFEKNSEVYQKRLKQANEAYLAKRMKDKKDAEDFKQRGNDFLKKKQFDKASEMYREAISRDKNNPIYYSNLAASLTAQKKFKEAHEACDKAIEIDPNYAKVYLRHGIICTHQKQYKKALEWFEKAKELEPDNVEMYEKRIQSVKKLLSEEKKQTGQGSTGNPFGGMFGSGGMPDLNQVLKNPEFMKMAQNVMSNPQFQNVMGNLMQQFGGEEQGGQGGKGGGINNLLNGFKDKQIPKEKIEELKNLPEVQKSEKLMGIVNRLETEGLKAIMDNINDPEVYGLMTKLSGEFYNDILGKGKKKDDDDDKPSGII